MDAIGSSSVFKINSTTAPSASFRRSPKQDALDSEFLYYSSVLKLLAPALTDSGDRQRVLAWLQKLFSPEYHSTQFKEKRNRYLLRLTLTLLNNETHGVFRNLPPTSALPEIEALEHETSPLAQWESDNTWLETLKNVPGNFRPLECSVHGDVEECAVDHSLDKILDDEFKFLLYTAKPYASLIQKEEERNNISTWLQTLCTISGSSCASMRGIRNDYMMALLGYIHDLRVVGPFLEYPPLGTIVPLAEAAKMAAESKPLTDPSAPEASDFLSQQNLPDEGAFCYIALTGELIASSLDQN